MWIIRGIVFHYYTIYRVTNENHVIVRLRALVSIKVWPVRILHFLWNFHAIFFLFSFLLCCWDIRIAIDWAIKSRSQCNYNFDSTSRSLSINRQISSIEFISLEFIYYFLYVYGAYQLHQIIIAIINNYIILCHRWKRTIEIASRSFANRQTHDEDARLLVKMTLFYRFF